MFLARTKTSPNSLNFKNSYALHLVKHDTLFENK